jgi:hypothetical protein
MRLSRVALDGDDRDRRSEDWLQALLFKHPELLPIGEIEPAFEPVIPVCRELPTPAGPLDLLFISPDGLPTLVECKLWRNPEARREVVAQVLDYAKELSRWNYADLVRATCRALGAAGDPLFAAANVSDEALPPHEFADAVARNLRRGRFVLLIVGEGIRESVEELAEFLHAYGHLSFTLALIELALHRLPDEFGGHLMVSPRVVTRTREIERAVVRVVDGSVVVEPPPQEDALEGGNRRIRLTEEVFFEQLDADAATKLALRDFLRRLDELDLLPDFRAQLHIKTPDRHFNFGTFSRDGEFRNYNALRLNEFGDLGNRYLERLAGLIPDGRVEWHENPFLVTVRQGFRPVRAEALIQHREGWFTLLADVRREMLAAEADAAEEGTA